MRIRQELQKQAVFSRILLFPVIVLHFEVRSQILKSITETCVLVLFFSFNFFLSNSLADPKNNETHPSGLVRAV